MALISVKLTLNYGWFDIMGHGVQYNLASDRKWFSERNGFKKWYYLGRYKFSFNRKKVND